MIEDDPKVLDGPNVISNESIDLIQNDLMNPKFSMIQKEFQLEVCTLLILKSTAIPPCLLVLFFKIEYVRMALWSHDFESVFITFLILIIIWQGEEHQEDAIRSQINTQIMTFFDKVSCTF